LIPNDITWREAALISLFYIAKIYGDALDEGKRLYPPLGLPDGFKSDFEKASKMLQKTTFNLFKNVITLFVDEPSTYKESWGWEGVLFEVCYESR